MERELKSEETTECTNSINLTKEIEKTDRELGNIRNSIRNGLKDVVWANEEIDRLKEQKKKLQTDLDLLEVKPKRVQISKSMVESYHRAFTDVLSHGTDA